MNKFLYVKYYDVPIIPRENKNSRNFLAPVCHTSLMMTGTHTHTLADTYPNTFLEIGISREALTF